MPLLTHPPSSRETRGRAVVAYFYMHTAVSAEAAVCVLCGVLTYCAPVTAACSAACRAKLVNAACGVRNGESTDRCLVHMCMRAGLGCRR